MKRRFTILAAPAPVAVMVLVGGLAAGCGDDEGDTLTVYAAASLTSTFEQIGEEFEAQNEGVEVKFTFAGSSDLVAQIQDGAPVDVFASADTATMDKLVADDLQGQDPQDFATNTLEIAVPPGNPAGIASFADLAEEGLNLVTCAPEVPCGAAAQKAAEAAGVTLSPVSEEQSVTDVLAKVASGEADAGLVYVTDVPIAGDAGDDVEGIEGIEGIEFPESSAAVNSYPITTVADSGNDDLAAAFVDLVLSDTGQSILADAGFRQP